MTLTRVSSSICEPGVTYSTPFTSKIHRNFSCMMSKLVLFAETYLPFRVLQYLWSSTFHIGNVC